MSRKDYRLIAEAMRLTKPRNQGIQALDCWYASVSKLADYLKSENARFDKDKFKAACSGTE